MKVLCSVLLQRSGKYKRSYRGCRTVVGRMTLVVKKRTEQRMEWWKLEKESGFQGGDETGSGWWRGASNVWSTTANVIRETSRRVLSVSSEKKVAKERPQRPNIDLDARVDNKEGETYFYRSVRQSDRYMKDVQQVRVIKDRYRDVSEELRCMRAVRVVKCVSR